MFVTSGKALKGLPDYPEGLIVQALTFAQLTTNCNLHVAPPSAHRGLSYDLPHEVAVRTVYGGGLANDLYLHICGC